MGTDPGAAFGLMAFLLVSVAQILLTLLVGSYAAYSFLVILVNTAAGSDHIRWPGDPLQDWIGKFWVLSWLLAVWTVPASLALGAAGVHPPASLPFLGLVLWLIFPVSLLSSLSASSAFVILRPTIVGLMLRHLGTTLRFYFSAGILFAICGGLLFLGIVTWWLALPVAGIASAVGCFIYARLVGRLGAVITWKDESQPKERRPPEAKRVQSVDPWASPDAPPVPSEAERRPRRRKKRPRAEAHDPWAPPPREALPPRSERLTRSVAAEDPYGPAEGTYELQPESPPPASRPASVPVESDGEGYALAPEAQTPSPKIESTVTDREAEEEMALAAPREHPAPPEHPLWTGVHGFVLYPETLAPLTLVAAGLTGMTFLLRVQLMFWPF